MKIAIENSKLAADTTALKAITEVSLTDLRYIWVDGLNSAYMYYTLEKAGDYAPNDQTNATGFWLKDSAIRYRSLMRAVEDDHVFDPNDPDGDTDVSSLKNWKEYGKNNDLDHVQICDEKKAIVIDLGYNTLSDADKKEALESFVAGDGNDFQDPLYTLDQYRGFAAIHYKLSISATTARNVMIHTYCMEEHMLGSITHEVCEVMCYEMKGFRSIFVSDIVIGKPRNDIEGVRNFVVGDESFAPKAITALTANIITINGTGHTNNTLSTLEIVDSTNNTGEYTITLIEENGGNTEYTVSETLNTSVIDGKVFHKGIRSHKGVTAAISTELGKIVSGEKKK